MIVGATVLRNNFSEYLEISRTEDILITKNDKVVARLSNPNREKEERFKELRGLLKGNTCTLEESRDERLAKI